ncbi:DDE-type integrase/transposase/recombinase [Ochrobactrum sp. BTU1]|uniref:DDE-type integrase/transposase/recombinase n=1 Tax=Ochrobactrum sp. BTU1 TaxID=2840456 RepID=UPI0040463A0A
MVEDMLAYHGITITHRTVREWADKFGRQYVSAHRCRTPRLVGKWHLDECVILITGEKHILWRAFDQHGFVLDVLLHNHRDTAKTLYPYYYKVRVLTSRSGDR